MQVEYIHKPGLPFLVSNDLSLLSDDQSDGMEDAVVNFLWVDLERMESRRTSRMFLSVKISSILLVRIFDFAAV